MPTPDVIADHPAQIRAVMAELDRQLGRMHLARQDRRLIMAEVRADLEAAAGDGVSPQTLIGADIAAFARETVSLGGYRPRPGHYRRVLIGGVVVATVALVAAYALIIGVVQPALSSWFTLDRHYPVLGPVVMLCAVVIVGVLGVLVGLRALLAGRVAARETLRRAALLLPVGAAGGAVSVIAVASAPGYRVTLGAVTLQVLIALLGVVLPLAVARWWALRAVTSENAAATGQ